MVHAKKSIRKGSKKMNQCVFFDVCGHNGSCEDCSRRLGLKDLLMIIPERKREKND